MFSELHFVYCFQNDFTWPLIFRSRMKGHHAAGLALLVLSSCVLQGFSLPQNRWRISIMVMLILFNITMDHDPHLVVFLQNLRGNCCRYSAEEYARKFGSAPAEENLTNDIDDAKPLAKEEGSLLSTVVEIAMKFVPLIIDTLAGSTGPSQTDRLVGLSDLYHHCSYHHQN